MTETDEKRSFTLTRIFDAPPDSVFRAWTDPERLGWFFNPDQPTPGEPPSVDLRVGGQWRQTMATGNEPAYVTGGLYREIVPGERLVFAWGAVGGWPALDPARPEDSPLATVELAPEPGGRTRMAFRLDLPAHLSAEEAREWFARGIEAGWTQTIDRLAAG